MRALHDNLAIGSIELSDSGLITGPKQRAAIFKMINDPGFELGIDDGRRQ